VDELPPGFGPDDPDAGDSAFTEHTSVSFTIKEGPSGQLWVLFEEGEPGLPVLKFGDAFLGLVFREGISFADAKQFTAEMRRKFDTLSFTKFVT
jgi:hypothetical protein